MADDQPAAQNLIFENVSPATRLLEKRRQMYEVQDALDNQKLHYAREEEQFKKKEDQLRQKDAHLQAQLIRFNKFLQDNEAKRRRAETRAAEESAQIKQREEEITTLEQQQAESKDLCVILEEDVKRNMRYEEYLERVKETSDDYSEVTELIARYVTLEDANKDLRERQQKLEKTNEEKRNEFQQYQKEKQLDILARTTETAELQAELETAEKECLMLEQGIDSLTQAESEQSLYLGQIFFSVDNLYQRCCTKRAAIQHKHGVEPVEAEKKDKKDEDEQETDAGVRAKECMKHLQVIGDYLKDFREMADIIKKEQRSKAGGHVAPDTILMEDPVAEIVWTSDPSGKLPFGNSDGVNTKRIAAAGSLAAGTTTQHS